jgi:hypothetical protein
VTKLAWAALALSSLVAREALGGPAPVLGPSGPGNPKKAPPPKSTGCDRYTVGVGPFTGWSFGDDQFLLGGLATLGHSCVRWLRFEPNLGLGLGGNWGTFRFGARARVTLFLGENERYGLTLLGGYGGLRSFPLGRFATFCKRTDLDQCWNTSTGSELGVAFEYWDFALSAIAGLEGLPDLALQLSYAFPARPATQRQP